MVEGLDKSELFILFWFVILKNILGVNYFIDLQKLLSLDNILQYLGYIKFYCFIMFMEKEILMVLIYLVW